MDMQQMGGASADPQPANGGVPAAPSQPNADAIAAACVAATQVAMDRMVNTARSLGHVPSVPMSNGETQQ